MTHNHGEPVQKETPDITAEQRAWLKELFTEGKLDFEKLRATLGDSDTPNSALGPALFACRRLSWRGKRGGGRFGLCGGCC